MWVIFNLPGLLFVGLGFGVGFLVKATFRSEDVGAMVGIVTASLLDVSVRIRHKEEQSVVNRLFLPSRGGHVFFVPVWCYGMLAALFLIMFVVVGGKFE